MIIWVAGEVVNTKVVDNLHMYLLLKFGGIWLSSLRVISVGRQHSQLPALWNPRTVLQDQSVCPSLSLN